MFATRKRKHKAKVRLPIRDIEDGNIESGERKMGDLLNKVPKF